MLLLELQCQLPLFFHEIHLDFNRYFQKVPIGLADHLLVFSYRLKVIVLLLGFQVLVFNHFNQLVSLIQL